LKAKPRDYNVKRERARSNLHNATFAGGKFVKNVSDWPHLWFGVWAEYGPAYEKCPSALAFVSPEVNRRYDKQRLRHYLCSAPEIAATSRSAFPNPFTGQRLPGSISFRTDGKWLWLDDLADYVDYHQVAIPDAWLADIVASNYNPPEIVSDEVMVRLERPPV
jgi:hypothetical protein